MANKLISMTQLNSQKITGDKQIETLCNDGSGLTSLDLASSMFKSKIGPMTTLFRNDAYIEKLNKQLRFELGAVSTYGRLSHGRLDPTLCQDLLSAHQKASRELCCMIISHHGLPDKETAPIFKVTSTLIDLYTQLPLSPKLLVMPLGNFEQHMSRRYALIIQEAPAQDRHTLTELKRLARKNRSLLRRFYRS